MAYNSSHTGAQIDAAVGAVREKESTWDGKQDALSGKSGQVVGFGADGKPKATDAPSGGMTESEADAKYLQLSGGCLRSDNGGVDLTFRSIHPSGLNMDQGRIRMSSNVFRIQNIFNTDAAKYPEIRLLSSKVEIGISGDTTPRISVSDDSVAIAKLKDPVETTDAANKAYVDKSVDSCTPPAFAVSLKASKWDTTAKTQNIDVSGVSADESEQFICPMPMSVSASAYKNAGIELTGQAKDTITFTADVVPTEDINVWILVQTVAPRKRCTVCGYWGAYSLDICPVCGSSLWNA